MRIAFAGTPQFARVALDSLASGGHEVCLVLTQPDRAAGRGLRVLPSPVKQCALALGLPVLQPRSLRLDGNFPQEAAQAAAALRAAAPQVLVVAAYGLILPQWVLDLPSLGCLNIHASLLPRWRGAAPIHRAIEAGDRYTGITIMQMDAGLDTGAMLLQERVPIGAQDTTASLHERLAELGADLMMRTLTLAQNDALVPVSQPEQGITYAGKIAKSEAHIDWTQTASVLERRIRAFNPAPVAWTSLGGELIKVWMAQALPAPLERSPIALAGTVLGVGGNGIEVDTSDGRLLLTELQRRGGKRLGHADFLRGFALHTGDRLGGTGAAAQASPG